jgi:transcriptional regulator with XRE-family HTH domain
MNTLQSQVGARIRELREQKRISQEALAGICNLHRTYIGLIERGKRSLSLATVEQIAIGLGVAPSDLFTAAKIAPVKAIVREDKKTIPASPITMEDLSADVAALRQVLIETKVIDPKRYESARKHHFRQNGPRK